MVDIKKAAEATSKYLEMEMGIDTGTEYSSGLELIDELSIEHQRDILNNIIHGNVTGEKAHRHFGWCQAALTVHGIGNLNTYRIINSLCK